MTFKIKDSKPQVGIFEIVDNIILVDTEEVSDTSESGRYFDGYMSHLHNRDVKMLVINHPSISSETKDLFKGDNAAYLKFPRGRVDYDTFDKTYHIMAAKKFFTNENVEKVLREFHLPPYATGKIVLEADDNHYGY